MNMNLFLEECGVFFQVFFINVTNKILNILTVARMTRMARPLARMARWLAWLAGSQIYNSPNNSGEVWTDCTGLESLMCHLAGSVLVIFGFHVT